MFKQFKLHWLDGKIELVEGIDIADAFSKAGYGAGAIRALDYFEEVGNEDHSNDPESSQD